MQVGLLGTFTSQFRHTSHRLALALALLYLVLNDLRNILMDVQVVVDLLLDEIAYIFINGLPVRSHLCRTQLDLRLTLEDRLLDIDGDSRHHTCSDVAILVFAKELLDGLGNMFLESTLMGATLCGVLSVYERVILLAILVGMGEGNLDIVTLQMDDRIERVVRHTILQQVFESMTTEDATPVIHNGQARIQIGVVTEHVLDNVVLEPIIPEQRVVGFEIDVRAVLVLRILRLVGLQDTTLEGRATHLALAIAGHFEVGTQGIHGLHTHTVQTHRLLKGLRVVLTTRIQHRDGFDELTLRDASAVVAHRDTQVIVDSNFDTRAGMHLEFVDAVVDNFLQQHIDTVLRQRTVAQTSDVHARTSAYMLHIRQVADIVVSILYLFFDYNVFFVHKFFL